MKVRPLRISGAFEFTPTVHADSRGVFLEQYRHESLEDAIGHPFVVRQTNTSLSSRGTLRGIHYALVPPGQAKYVSVIRGAVVDYVVDLRLGSPTFAEWEEVRLDDQERRSLYIAEGLGHAFVALADDTAVSYLVSEVYNPQRELGISPHDPDIGLRFPDGIESLRVSPKDEQAPSLQEAIAAGKLATLADCQAHAGALSRETTGRA